MIITKEEQDKLAYVYLQTHTASQTQAFCKGMEAMMKLVDNKLKQQYAELKRDQHIAPSA